MTKPEEQRRYVENLRLSLLNFVSKLSYQFLTLESSSLLKNMQNEFPVARNLVL